MRLTKLTFLADKAKQKAYLDAVVSQECGLEACEVLNYRLTMVDIAPGQNVAAISLFFSDDSTVIKTQESSGTKILKGHSERRALALAINESIDRQLGMFKGMIKITNCTQVEPDELMRFQYALSQLKKITIYTERVPCSKPDNAGNDSCDKFFANLFKRPNYQFYYSVELGYKMIEDLKEQVSTCLANTGLLNERKEELSKYLLAYKKKHSDSDRTPVVVKDMRRFEQKIRAIDDLLNTIKLFPKPSEQSTESSKRPKKEETIDNCSRLANVTQMLSGLAENSSALESKSTSPPVVYSASLDSHLEEQKPSHSETPDSVREEKQKSQDKSESRPGL